ncbi:MAG: hypothetical protein K940chlam3_00555 [Chlamydiae bacterium]|nr:hypothetical protein [Chlamydiota bacterium]
MKWIVAKDDEGLVPYQLYFAKWGRVKAPAIERS